MVKDFSSDLFYTILIFKLFSLWAAPCSAMAYHHDSRRIFVGQDNGAIIVSLIFFEYTSTFLWKITMTLL